MCMIQSGGGSSPGTPAESPEPYVLQPQPSAGQPLPMPMPGFQREEASPLPTAGHLRPLAAADLPFVGGGAQKFGSGSRAIYERPWHNG